MSEEIKEGFDKDGWEITAKRFVGYIDIMGFKDLVARSTHEEIYEMMKNIYEQRTTNINIYGKNKDLELVRTTTYSDSIMIYTKDESKESFESFLMILSSLTNDLFIEGVPHKGAVAFGMMTLDLTNSIFFGQPLIDAYLLQEELFFYGIIIHASAEQKIDTVKQIDRTFMIKNYFCPLKNGNSWHLTIYPFWAPEDLKTSQYKEHSKNLFDAIKKLRYQTSGYLRKYIDNTEAYLNFINKGE